MSRIEIEDICEPEWAAWYRMAPEERWEESARLWQQHVIVPGHRHNIPGHHLIVRGP